MSNRKTTASCSCKSGGALLVHKHPLKASLQAGRQIRIPLKVVREANRFQVNLTCSDTPVSDIALMVDVRMYDKSVDLYTLRSRRCRKIESINKMPFNKDGESSILIRCDEYYYQIAVNGKHFAECKHRGLYKRVTHLQINGDVRLIPKYSIQEESGRTTTGRDLGNIK